MNSFNKLKLAIGAILILGFFGYRSYIKRNPVERNVEQTEDITDKFEAMTLDIKSLYSGNSLKNGDSPFDKLKGKGKYSNTTNSLLVKNRGSSDLVIFLTERYTEKVIRNEYINSHSEFDMTKIPNVECYVKYYYGRDWNPTRKTKGIVTGGFDNGEEFVISDSPDDIFRFRQYTEGDYIYSSNFTLTLETLETLEPYNNKVDERDIPAEIFFN
jgi:hypothetical protein